MKKVTVFAALMLCAAVFCSCGAANGSSAAAKENTDVTTTVQTAAPDDENVTTETFTLPSKETFAQIPEDAEQSFDVVIKAVKASYPAENKTKRLYGYLGEEEVNDCQCYIFAVYDKNKDVHTEVATVAASVDGSSIFVYNAETLTYDVLDIPEDTSSAKTEYHWAEDSSSYVDDVNSDSTLDSSSQSESDLSSADTSSESSSLSETAEV